MTVNLLLLLGVVLVVVVLAEDSRSLTRQQCHKASKAACAWVTHHEGERSTAHRGTPCKEAGTRCVYRTTCHLNRLTRDIYVCQKTKHFGVNPNKHVLRNAHAQKPTKVRIHARVFKKPEGSSVHHRTRRSVDEARAHAARQATSQRGAMPYLFQKIIQRHRSYNVNAFNKGTYFLNGYSYVNNLLQSDNVSKQHATETTPNGK